MSELPAYTLSVAPMLDWTDRHYRYMARLLSPSIQLYTEMVVDQTILRGDKPKHLDFNTEEHPVVLQLGGSRPEWLAEAARVGEEWGYDEINLNLGCPSDKVQGGGFGACLMKEPALVAECFTAMKEAVKIPVTAKHRLGVDDIESYEYLSEFVSTLSKVGINTFIVHARKALLKGLSPSQNRSVPPLRYEWVYQLKQDFPQLNIVLNGGVTDLEQAKFHLQKLDGVMLGRVAYENPFVLSEVEREIFGKNFSVSREEVVQKMKPYIEREMAEKGTPLWSVSRHMLNLFKAQHGGRLWRRVLSEKSNRKGCGVEVFDEALEAVHTAAASALETLDQRKQQQSYPYPQ